MIYHAKGQKKNFECFSLIKIECETRNAGKVWPRASVGFSLRITIPRFSLELLVFSKRPDVDRRQTSTVHLTVIFIDLYILLIEHFTAFVSDQATDPNNEAERWDCIQGFYELVNQETDG